MSQNCAVKLRTTLSRADLSQEQLVMATICEAYHSYLLHPVSVNELNEKKTAFRYVGVLITCGKTGARSGVLEAAHGVGQ